MEFYYFDDFFCIKGWENMGFEILKNVNFNFEVLSRKTKKL